MNMPVIGENCGTMVYKIGILEVQGAFQEHKIALLRASESLKEKCELDIIGVRHASHIYEDMDGLIIPGGESTTISLFLKRNKMEEPLRKWIENTKHVTWGTCAGMILMSKHTEHQKCGGQPTLGVMDTVVSRNYFGRQIQSFEAPVSMNKSSLSQNGLPASDFHGVFIRAPAVTEVCGQDVDILATLCTEENSRPVIVAVRQNNVMATAFHPELTEDVRWHTLFLQMIENVKQKG